MLNQFSLDGVTDSPGEQIRFNTALDEVVLRPRVDRGEREPLVAVAADDHHRKPGQARQELPDRLQAVAVGQAQVDQRAISPVSDAAEVDIGQTYDATPLWLH